MKYILGTTCLFLAIMCYTKPDFFTDNPYLILGNVYILLADLFIKKQDKE